MAIEVFDNNECKGQMSIDDLYSINIPENLFAVSKIFARARKQMNLPEFKAFTYALTKIRFTEENGNKVMMDKRTLAKIVGVNSDSNHLSQDLKRSIGNLPLHSYIEIDDKDNDFYESGVVVTSLRMYKNNACITFNPDYMPMFSKLEREYITMWSSDIYSMTSERSIEFYEQLRLNTDTRNEINTAQVGIKWFKELFNIPKEGKGSYMREKGGFNRAEFERKVIEPLCDDLAKCKMINLVLQPNGKYYEKVKQNGRVVAYRFDWTYTSHPRVGTAIEIQNVQNEIEKNPEILKVAKDIIKGTKKKNKFNSFENQNKYNMDELESQILAN
jgi:stalled ribosome alternative rescue factor ArfA